jgi:hypothetical protein
VRVNISTINYSYVFMSIFSYILFMLTNGCAFIIYSNSIGYL